MRPLLHHLQRPVKTLKYAPPKHRGYKGTYTSLSCCAGCATVALEADVNPLAPCTVCGGLIVTNGLYGQWKADTQVWDLAEQTKIIIASFL
jgi:hypothetical protein